MGFHVANSSLKNGPQGPKWAPNKNGSPNGTQMGPKFMGPKGVDGPESMVFAGFGACSHLGTHFCVGPIWVPGAHLFRDELGGSVGALGPIWRPKADFLEGCGGAEPPHEMRGGVGGRQPPHPELVQDFLHQPYRNRGCRPTFVGERPALQGGSGGGVPRER